MCDVSLKPFQMTASSSLSVLPMHFTAVCNRGSLWACSLKLSLQPSLHVLVKFSVCTNAHTCMHARVQTAMFVETGILIHCCHFDKSASFSIVFSFLFNVCTHPAMLAKPWFSPCKQFHLS